MKKTLTINLGGIVYHIEDDAYHLLDNYFSNLRHYFCKQEGVDEIVDDIEMRIAELFGEKITERKQVVTFADVEEVIERMGKPEDFGMAEEETEAQKKAEHTTAGAQDVEIEATGQRRWYRDADNGLLGGVAAGIAAYFDCDVMLVRILMILMLVLPYFLIIPLYLIAWVVVPQARTAAEKLSMHGKAITVENIGKAVTDGFERVTHGANEYINSGKPRNFLQKMGDLLVDTVVILFKIFLVALVIICCPVLFLLALLLVMLVFAVLAMVVSGGTLLYETLPAIGSIDWMPVVSMSPMMTVLSTLAAAVFVAIPLGAFLHIVLRQLFHWSPMGTGLKWSLFVLWILSAVMLIVNFSAFGGQLLSLFPL